MPLLRSGGVPDDALAHQIAVAKVKAVEYSIDLCWRLKQEVGSYALMGDSGFGSMDLEDQPSPGRFAEVRVGPPGALSEAPRAH